MTHQACDELVSFNLDLIGLPYMGTKVKGFAMIDSSSRTIEEDLVKVMAYPEVPAELAEIADYDLYAALSDDTNVPFNKFMELVETNF
jgi:hypothetical protein